MKKTGPILLLLCLALICILALTGCTEENEKVETGPVKGHSDNLVAVHYPEERAVLAVDALWIDRVSFLDLPFKHFFPGAIEGLRIIEDLDFDILLTGHGVHGTGGGAIGVKEDVREFREYFEALYDKVVKAREDGLGKEEAMASIKLPEYSHLGMFDKWFKLNIKGMWFHMYGE